MQDDINSALQLHQNGDLKRAAVIYNQLLAENPKDAAARHLLGVIAFQLGNFKSAREQIQFAISLRPDVPEFYNNLGEVFRSQGNFQESILEFEKAIALRPEYANAHNNLGVVYKDLWQHDKAISHFETALQIDPNYIDPLYNLAATLHEQLLPDQAIELFHQVIAKDPTHFNALINLGKAFSQKGQYAESISVLNSAELRFGTPSIRYARAATFPVILTSTQQMNDCRDHLESTVSDLLSHGIRFDPFIEKFPNHFGLAYHGENDKQLLKLIGKLFGPSSDEKPSLQAYHSSNQIHLGLISNHFRDHTIGRLWKGLVAHLSRQKIKVTVFSLGSTNDIIATEIRNSADNFIDLPQNLQIARDRIAGENLDILFYTDIGMHPSTYTLATTRLAAIQCATWGHPSTTGLPTIDYFISSELLEIDEADNHYTEKLIRLKTLGLYIEKPDIPVNPKNRADFNLPEEKNLYGCLQSLFKFHPHFDELLGKILRADPNGILLIPTGTHSNWNNLLRKRFETSFSDVVDQVQFIPRQTYEDFLQLNQLVEVLLVPPQFGGGRTSYEALALGTPIVTMPSPYLKGRITYGLYQAMGVLDCVAHNSQEYVEIAVRLGTDPIYRTEISQKILNNNHRLFEDMEAIDELEQFFIRTVEERRM